MCVGLFVICFIDLMWFDIGFLVFKLLEKVGYDVVVLFVQICCGQFVYNFGDWLLVCDFVEKMFKEFEQFDYVVILFGLCGGMICKGYVDFF